MIKISIITINYNDEKGLKKTLLSVFNQTFQDFEFIIIDGGSTDGSREVIEQYKDKIDYWISEPDKGIYNAMNKGIKAASGEFLLFLNSGDRLIDKNITEKVISKLESNIDIYYGKLVYSLNGVQKTVYTPPENINLSFFISSFLPHPATFIKRTLFENQSFYNENLRIIADWEFLLKAIVVYNSSYKFIDLLISDFDNSGVSSDSSSKMKIELERQKVFNDVFPYLTDEIDALHFVNSKRIKQIKQIQKNSFIWKILKGIINILYAFTKNKEKKPFVKINSKSLI